MLDQEDRRAGARSAAKSAQLEAVVDRVGRPDVAAPTDRHAAVFVVASACLLACCTVGCATPFSMFVYAAATAWSRAAR
jgi:hypothetical protein